MVEEGTVRILKFVETAIKVAEGLGVDIFMNDMP